MEEFFIRQATAEDMPLVLTLIRELAAYEKLEDQVEATLDTLNEWIVEKQKAEVLLGIWNGEPVEYALFFHNFSTFLGRSGIYLEDIYVRPYARGKGFGKAFFRHLAGLCLERGCGRLEWCCLDWNKPSIDFYRSMGAQAMDEWTIYRLSKAQLEELAK